MTDQTPCPSAPCKRSPVGRPRDPAKDDAILKAARELFFARGFNGTAIEEIAQCAGVSKVTVYKRFGDKETLFETCVRNEIANMATVIESHGEGEQGLEDRLNAFGVALLSFMFRPRHVAMDRVTAQEFVQMPDLARRVFAAGPEQSRARLAAVLAEACDEGILECDDPMRAAVDLVALWKGYIDVELKFGIRDTMEPDAIDEQVRHGTRTFLRAYEAHPDHRPERK